MKDQESLLASVLMLLSLALMVKTPWAAVGILAASGMISFHSWLRATDHKKALSKEITELRDKVNAILIGGGSSGGGL